MDLATRLPQLVSIRRELLNTLEMNARDPSRDKNGSATALLALTNRFLGVGEFVLTDDPAVFSKHMAVSCSLRLGLFKRSEKGDPISESYLSMLAYKPLLSGLAAGSFELAQELAGVMGGRPELELEHDHEFDRLFGYALVAAVLQKKGPEISNLTEYCLKTEPDFLGYALLLSSIEQGDREEASRNLQQIVDGHQEQCRRGVFKGSEDELVCVWGVGVANLARHRGIDVESEGQLIPDALLAESSF